jgi:hypothetical protein
MAFANFCAISVAATSLVRTLNLRLIRSDFLPITLIFDLAIAGKGVFEAVLGTCHPYLHLIHGLRMLWVF